VKRKERPTSTSTIHAGDLKLHMQWIESTKSQIAERAEASRSDEREKRRARRDERERRKPENRKDIGR
jgi:hypothetical protein